MRVSSCLLAVACLVAVSSSGAAVSQPPPELGFNSFYTKYVDSDGLAVLASGNVDDSALYVVAAQARVMFLKRPDLRESMIAGGVHIAIIGDEEVTTDIPEYANLYTQFPGTDWNVRTRGISATSYIPVSSCAEENVLGHAGDRYHGENIFVHEFAHSILLTGIARVDSNFRSRLEAAFSSAVGRGLWSSTYAGSNVDEYWAEGVQSWFEVNAQSIPADGIHNFVNTRAELRSYDPALYSLIAEIFAPMDVEIPAGPTSWAADFDGDKRSDVAWRDVLSGANMIWAGAQQSAERTLPTVSTNYAIRGVGDFDGDGKDDLLWRAETGENVIWLSGNRDTRRSVSRLIAPWSVAAIGDFDGDRRDDILWRNLETGAGMFWRSADAGHSVPIKGVSNLLWKIVGVGDFGGDGIDDVLWRNSDTGANVIWNSAKSASTRTVGTLANPLWRVVGAADFDGDGTDDILWRNVGNGANMYWRGGEASASQPLGKVIDQSWRVEGVGDYDGDSHADILWRHVSSGSNLIWLQGKVGQRMKMPVLNWRWNASS